MGYVMSYGRTQKTIEKQNWVCQYGQVINERGERVVGMNRERYTNGYIMPPTESDALTYALAGFPELYRAAKACLGSVGSVRNLEMMVKEHPDNEAHKLYLALALAVKACEAHDKI